MHYAVKANTGLVMSCESNADPYCDEEGIWILLFSGQRQNCDPFSISAPLQWATLQDDM